MTYFTSVIDFTEIQPMGAVVRNFECVKGVFISHGRVQVISSRSAGRV